MRCSEIRSQPKLELGKLHELISCAARFEMIDVLGNEASPIPNSSVGGLYFSGEKTSARSSEISPSCCLNGGLEDRVNR